MARGMQAMFSRRTAARDNASSQRLYTGHVLPHRQRLEGLPHLPPILCQAAAGVKSAEAASHAHTFHTGPPPPNPPRPPATPPPRWSTAQQNSTRPSSGLSALIRSPHQNRMLGRAGGAGGVGGTKQCWKAEVVAQTSGKRNAENNP